MKRTLVCLVVLALCTTGLFAQKKDAKADPKAADAKAAPAKAADPKAAAAAPAAAAAIDTVVLYYSDDAKDDAVATAIQKLAKADVFKIDATGKTTVDVTKYKNVYIGSVVKGEKGKEVLADPVKTYLGTAKLTGLKVGYYGTAAAALPAFNASVEPLIKTAGGDLLALPKGASNIFVNSDKKVDAAIKKWLGR